MLISPLIPHLCCYPSLFTGKILTFSLGYWQGYRKSSILPVQRPIRSQHFSILPSTDKTSILPLSIANQITGFQYPSQKWQKVSILPLSTANQIAVFPYPSSLARMTMFSHSTNNLIARIQYTLLFSRICYVWWLFYLSGTTFQ